MFQGESRTRPVRILATVGNFAIDLLLPTVLYAVLAPTGLPAALRLSLGGSVVAAKALGGRIGGRFRWGPALLTALIPSAALLGCHLAGYSDTTSMVAGAIVAAVIVVTDLAYTRFGSENPRPLDGFAVLVLLEVVASVVLTSLSGDARFVLARASFYIALAGVYFFVSAWGTGPFMQVALKPVHTEGDPPRVAAFDRLWAASSRFRRIYRVLTAALGLVLLADAGLRLAVIYSYPPDRVGESALTSNLPLIVLLALYFVIGRTWSAPRAERMLDAETRGRVTADR
ncbi:VC0807 family protein [Nocardia pseudobrasiliensis]|uniref:Uncharacterized protein n=1 Tax=Nocardia pseudobrasiliensis TaxID=45979 RepID=A0A370IET6_9NOCA|nr:VC0807 family protein [Nocardia pseudobrasiliensis]RDI69237.1 hypothetical protein DFR76_101775 [Nocardia pseudobrasiliensis]